MKISTALFGEIEIDASKIITFEDGIPAFPELKNFILLHDEESDNSIFSWLQSTTDPSMMFVIADISMVIPDYAPRLNEAELSSLGSEDFEHFILYTIATVEEDLAQTTVNLKAPVVININTQKGKQLVCDNEEYEIRYKIFGDNKKD